MRYVSGKSKQNEAENKKDFNRLDFNLILSRLTKE